MFFTNKSHLFPEADVGVPGDIAQSDHALVSLKASVRITCRYWMGLGRVWWATDAEWASTLATIEDKLGLLATVVQAFMASTQLQSLVAQKTAVASRRKLLDAVIWLREAWYIMCGHLAGLVRAHHGRTANAVHVQPKPIDEADEPVDDWKNSRRSLCKFLELWQTDKGAADKLLSKWLKPVEGLVLQLCDTDTRNLLTGPECIPLVVDELHARAAPLHVHHSSTDTARSDFVCKVRASSARVHPISGSHLGGDLAPLDSTELGVVIKGLHAQSRCLRLCYASRKVDLFGARSLTLACVNFSIYLQLA